MNSIKYILCNYLCCVIWGETTEILFFNKTINQSTHLKKHDMNPIENLYGRFQNSS